MTLKLHLKSGPRANEQLEVAGERWVVGREEGADLLLDDEEVSREHAALRVLPDGRLAIEDLGSSNGTFVNGHRLTGPVSLSGGEEIRIGETMISVMEAGAGATKIAAPPAPTPPVPPPAVATPPPPTPQPPPQPRPAARPPARPAAAPPPRKKSGAGTIIALIVSVLVLLAVGGAVAFVLTSGGTSQALHKVGLGGGWSDEFVAETQESCMASGTSESDCECQIDELQNRLSEDEAREIDEATADGVSPLPHQDDLIDAVQACGIAIS